MDMTSFAANSPIATKFDKVMQNNLPMTINRSKSKPEVQFQNGGVRFQKSGVVLSQPWIEISHRNLVCH